MRLWLYIFGLALIICLLYACKQLGVRKDEVIFVGDTLVDLLAARNAGIKVILVQTGVFGDYFPINEVGYEPMSIIPSVGKDLITILSQI